MSQQSRRTSRRLPYGARAARAEILERTEVMQATIQGIIQAFQDLDATHQAISEANAQNNRSAIVTGVERARRQASQLQTDITGLQVLALRMQYEMEQVQITEEPVS
jgi:hypothetical protein